MVPSDRSYIPSKEHIALVHKVSRLLNKWKPFMAFSWEWEGKVLAVEHIHDNQEVDMCIESYDFLRRSDISVAKSATHLSDEELELTVLHELGHLFLRDLYISHYHEIKAGGLHPADYDHSPWGHNEELTCWRFAKLLQAHDQQKTLDIDKAVKKALKSRSKISTSQLAAGNDGETSS